MRSPRRFLTLAGFLAAVALIGAATPPVVRYFVANPTDRDTLHAAQVRIGTDSLQQFGGALARRLGARIDSLEGELLNVPVVIPPPDPPPDNTVQLPTDTVPLPNAPTSAACTVNVNAGANLQAAINAATSGAVLCLAAATWNGPITLPMRADTNWVTIRPQSTDASFANPGVRIRPTTAANLPRIQGSGAQVILVAAGAVGWRLIGLDVRTTAFTYALLMMGEYSNNTLAKLPRKIVLERSYLHASPATQSLRRCVAMNGAYMAVIDSWLEECHEVGSDSQAITGCTGTGPYRISNNTLIAESEVIMFGGCDPAIAQLVAADITIRRNHIYLPPTWKGQWTPVKSRVEMKSALRVEIANNVIDGAWVNGHQGEAITLKSADQSGGCHQCRTADVTIQNNLMKNVGRGIYIVGRDNSGSASSHTDSVVRRVQITKNYLDTLNVSPNLGGTPIFQHGFIAGAEDVEVSYNTSNYGKGLGAYLMFSSDGTFGLISVNGATISNNVFLHGQYGVVGCPTAPAWTNCASSVTFGVNAVVGGTGLLVPNAVTFSTVAAATAAGYGVTAAQIAARTAGVVVAR